MLDGGRDQAAGLRALMAQRLPMVLAFALGPQRQERWIAQLAHAFVRSGHRPLVVDAVRGAVASAFGLRLRHELIDLLEGGRDFEEVAKATADGVYVMRADRGVEAFVASGAPAQRLIHGFARLSHGFDPLMLAMPAGELACLVDPQTCTPVVSLAAGHTGRVDGYGLVKQLAQEFGFRRFACVVQDAASAQQAQAEHARLAAAASRFLQVQVMLAGHLPPAGDSAPQLRRLAQALLDTAVAPLPLQECAS